MLSPNILIGENKFSRSKTLAVTFDGIADDVPWSTVHPQSWYHLCRDAGASTVACINFLENDVMSKVFEDNPQRTIMHDKLSSHKSPEVAEAVYKRGHRVKCRVPYRQHGAPIGLVFD